MWRVFWVGISACVDNDFVINFWTHLHNDTSSIKVKQGWETAPASNSYVARHAPRGEYYARVAGAAVTKITTHFRLAVVKRLPTIVLKYESHLVQRL